MKRCKSKVPSPKSQQEVEKLQGTWQLEVGGGVPDRNMGSCLDPGLPGTGLQRRKGEGEEGTEAGPGPPSSGKISWNPAELEET